MLTFIDNALEGFLAEDDGQPVTMLNLLRFHPEGGRERYAEYLTLASPILARFGAVIVYFGNGSAPLSAEPGQSWDAVALIRYPSRQAFVSMVIDSEYRTRAGPVRQAALIEAVLQPLATAPA